MYLPTYVKVEIYMVLTLSFIVIKVYKYAINNL